MFPKTEYIRSKPLMLAARKLPCQNCGISDGTVCGAHANSAAMGKGRSIKASDQYIASLCHRCHAEVDQGRTMSRSERERVWIHAHIKTVKEMLRLSLWPEGVPVPDMRRFDA